MPGRAARARPRPSPRVDWKRLRAEAQTRFHIEDFRPGQRELIECVLSGRNALGILPTGAGKSLCYQLPALFIDGAALVISPLIALMQDQHEHMQAAAISSLRLDSSVSISARQQGEATLTQGQHEVVLMTAERLQKSKHLEPLKRRRISLVVIDEAHCVSAWGHDFRPAYLELRHVIRELGSPPVLALTATAPPDRVDDILDTLGIPEARIVQEAIDRENLDFEVKRTVNLEEKQAQLLAILKHARGAGIIYAATVREVNELYEWLANQQIPAVRYHGKLAMRERSRAQQCFMSGDSPLIVATNAFGLGVDKPDVRFVVHWNFPDSVESYYQEAGRAGRDGQSARCILFYRLEDKQVRSFFLGGKHPRADEVTRVLRALKSQTGAGQPRTITQLTEDTGLSERRVRVICSSLEATHLLHRRRNGRQLTRAMTEKEVEGFVRSFEEHAQADHGRLEQIMRYGESARCRMQFFREYFGEVPGTPCGHCDNCLHPVAAMEATTADTAADSPRAEPGEALSVGSQVRHTRFGRGEVTSIEDGQVLVTFARHGQRRVLAHYLQAAAT